MEYDGKYSEGSKFGNTNTYGFFIRHTDNTTFSNRITINPNDSRPWLIQEHVKNVTIQNNQQPKN